MGPAAVTVIVSSMAPTCMIRSRLKEAPTEMTMFSWTAVLKLGIDAVSVYLPTGRSRKT